MATKQPKAQPRIKLHKRTRRPKNTPKLKRPKPYRGQGKP